MFYLQIDFINQDLIYNAILISISIFDMIGNKQEMKLIKVLLQQITVYFMIDLQLLMIDRQAIVVLFTLYLTITTLNGLSHKSRDIQFGCRVLYLHHQQTDDEKGALREHPYQINYQSSYDKAPVAIIGLIGSLQYEELDQVQTAKLIKGKTTEQLTEIKIRATEGIKIVKITYFLLDHEYSLKFGISCIYSRSFSSPSISREEQMIHISQIMLMDNSGQTKLVKEYTEFLPLFSNVDEMQSTIILNQLNIIPKGQYSYSLHVQKTNNQFKIIYDCPFQTIINQEFVSYILIIYSSALLQMKNNLIIASIPLQNSFSDEYFGKIQNIMLGMMSVSMIESSKPIQLYNTKEIGYNVSSGNMKLGYASILFLNMRNTAEDSEQIGLLSQIQDEQLNKRRLISCSPPYYSTVYSNRWPTWLDPVKTNIETCQLCPTGCYSCTYCSSCLRYVNCTSCRSGFTFGKIGYEYWPTMYVCKCTTGFPNATTNTCMGCSDVIPFCTSCVSKASGHFSSTCGTCTTGYFTVPNDGSWGGYIECGKCIPGCSGCSSFTSCTTCATGLVNVAGICSCSSSTSYYSTTTKTCTTCPLAISGCTTCTAVGAATTCVACGSGFYLFNGTCSACQSNCLTCTSTLCSSCSATFITSGQNCVCNEAAESFLNNSTNKCQPCSKFIAGCLDCNLAGGIMSCLDCTTGTYYNGTTCRTCPTYCTDCSNTSACTSCINNLAINGTVCSCPSGSYLNVLTSTCIVCNELFPSCSTCVTNTSTLSLECSDCSVGYYLNALLSCEACPQKCSDCSNFMVCTACSTGYVLNNITNDCDCIGCANCTAQGLVNCSLCLYNSTNSSYQCSACIGGFYLSGTSCVICSPGCGTCNSPSYCLTCSLPFIPGATLGQCVCNSLNLYYYNPTGTTCSLCGDVITNCSSCSSTNYVTTCIKCIDGYYTDGTSCFGCSALCPICSSSTVCLSCISTYILVNGQCICNNASQQYRSNNTGYCQSCQVITSLQCLNCQPQPAALATSGVKCTSCSDGYYPDLANFICAQCPTTCTTCTAIACLSCQPTFTLINDTCICDQAVNFYPSGQICRPCFAIIDYCLQCSVVNGQTQCTSCGLGTFSASLGTQCKLCSINCANCTSESICLTCNDGYNLSSNATCQCITTCSNYTNADSSCISCNMTNSTLQCLACKTGTFLLQKSICSPCPTTCTSCIDAVTCLLCQASFTLISGQCTCNQYFGEIIYNSLCQSCSQMIDGCSTCSLVSGSPSCSACIAGWTLTSGICTYCGAGCEVCTVVGGVVNCNTCNEAFFPLGVGCVSNGTNCTSAEYYDSANNSCQYCGANCDSCFDASGCILCQSTFKNIDGICVCSEGLGYFHDDLLDTCVQCVNTLNGTATYLQNCKRCHQKTGNFDSGIECLECIDGYYINFEGTCAQCASGCLKCTSPTTCYSCLVPFWTMVNGVCDCNNDLSYFTDNMGNCPKCTISNCSLCISLTECILCDFGYFINPNETCQLAVCSNNATQGIQTCDDGNQIDGDGCSSTCQVQVFYFCNNDVTPSICYYDNRFNIEISQIINDCNKVTFKFRIYPYYSYYDSAPFDSFLYRTDIPFSTLQSYSHEGEIVSYTYSYTSSLQGIIVLFQFSPTSLGLNQTSTYPIAKTSFQIDATNNQQVIHYSQEKCKQKQSLQQLTDAMQYVSYGIMIASALPAKIVGLQLSGVMQLSFFAIGSMDNVNILLSPLKKFKNINGFLMPIKQSEKRLLQTSTSTPERVQSIEYTSNFIRNCNIMLLLVVVLLLISIFLIFATYIFKNCAPTLFSISQRLLKQVMLTLILFNCFNFAYSAGIHFRYASNDDDLYALGTTAAIIALIFPFLMAIALLACTQDGFGEFKDKMKKGCIQKGYFVVTIGYRTCLGLYMSSSNEEKLSTLIILAISIMFLLYNLVNLPFVKAYHNYRANICHLTQFICLFVAMYYRSIKGSSSPIQTAQISSPVFLQYVCIFLSLIVSLIVLLYEIYVWIKECRNKKNTASTRIQNTSQDLPNNPNSSMMKSNEKENIHELSFDMVQI